MNGIRSSARGWLCIGAAAAALAGLCAGSAWAQIRVSGLEHMPIGGATFDPPVERRLQVRNLGSSGEDGVEISLNSRWGGAVRIDLDEMLIPSPAAREIRIRPRGWDGTVKGSTRLASRPPDGTPGSSMDLECDFAAVSATTARVTVRDQFGNVVLSRVVSGSSIQCVVSAVADGVQIPSVRHAIKTKGTGAESNRSITIDFEGITCDVIGLSPAPLHEVRSIEISPETCGACDTWSGTESLLVTASGVSQCVVSDASIGTFRVSSHALGAAHVDEMCANPADCDNVRRIRVDNLGSSGQDGVEIQLFSGLSPGEGGGSGGTVALRKGELTGHVTLMKAFDDEGTETGRVSRYHDPIQNREWLEYLGIEAGTLEVTVSLRDAAGLEIDRLTLPGPHHAVRVMSGAPGGIEQWSCHSGRWGVEFPVAYTIQLGNGAVHGGVHTVHFLPTGGSSLHRCRVLHVLSNAAAGPVEVLSVDPAPARVLFDGLGVSAVGAAVISHASDGSRRIKSPCCLGSSGEDGVEVHMRSQFGGSVGIDVAPLRGASSAHVRMRRRGWDGIIYGNHRMSSVPGVPDAIDLTLDYSAMGATGFEWVAVREGGRTVGAGQVSEIVVRIIPNGGGGGGGGGVGGGPAVWRAIGTKGTGIKFYDEFDFGGEVCLVTGLGASPLTDVVALRVQPIECPGCTPWTDVDTMELTFEGMESLDLHSAALHTFDVRCRGVDGASLMEWDDQGQITMKVDKTGSSLLSGVSLDWNVTGEPGGPGAVFSVAAGNCCRGHVIIMKAFDDEGGEAMRVSQSSDEGGTSHTMEFDWSALGSASTAHIGRLLDSNDAPLSSLEIAGSVLALSYIGPCDASAPRRVRCDGNEFVVELCDAPVTVFVQGMPVAGVRKVSVTVDESGLQTRSVEVTGSPTDYLEISSVEVLEGAPTCPADFDGNGVRDVGDIFAFLSAWFAGQPAAVNFGGTTGVSAIFAFLTAWFAGC